ncbi:MAG: type I-A CRISPR-associated protein Cas4/Csa1 [Chloroflexota bacterium]
MYFLNDEERRLLVGRLLPQARRHEVHPELRGWNWREPPLAPTYDVQLGASEVASKYCASGRDLYLRRVLGVRAGPTRAMWEGAALHRALADAVVRAKQIIYAHGAERCLPALLELAASSPEVDCTGAPPGVDPMDLAQRIAALRTFEYHRLVGRVAEALGRQPHVGMDSLVALALPITAEEQLDGSLLGLSAHLSADAVAAFAPLVFDVKFGGKRDFHHLATAAYALVLESLYEYPVDVGCLVYVRFAGERVLVERDLHLVDDELRQSLIDERDERARLVSEEEDPGVAERCEDDCPYASRCRRA